MAGAGTASPGRAAQPSGGRQSGGHGRLAVHGSATECSTDVNHKQQEGKVYSCFLRQKVHPYFEIKRRPGTDWRQSGAIN